MKTSENNIEEMSKHFQGSINVTAVEAINKLGERELKKFKNVSDWANMKSIRIESLICSWLSLILTYKKEKITGSGNGSEAWFRKNSTYEWGQLDSYIKTTTMEPGCAYKDC